MKSLFGRFIVAAFLAGMAAIDLSQAADVAASSNTTTIELSADVSTAPIAGATVLTLPQAIKMALDHATTIMKARTQRELTGSELLQAYFEFLPAVDVTAGYNAMWGRSYLTSASPTTVAGTNHGASYEATATLNLFNGFADAASLAAARRFRTASDLSLYRAQQEIELDVTNAYLQVLLDRQLVRIGEKNLQASQERVKLLDAQAQVGSRSLADLYRQQAQASADELDYISERNRAHNDLVSLLQRLRVDLRQPYDIASVSFELNSSSNPYTDESSLMVTALNQRPDLRQAQLTAEATRRDVTVARSGYYPRLDLYGTFAGQGRILDNQTVDGMDVVPDEQQTLRKQLQDQTQTTVGAVLNWGIFNRYLDSVSVARAQAAANDAAVDYDDKRLQVEAEVQQTMGDYEASLLQLNVASEGTRAAQESYDAVNERYKVGASSILDLLIAQTALVQAHASDAQAQINFVLQKKTMETVLGETPVR